MPLLLPALSAVVAIQAPAPSPVDGVQGLVAAIPEAFIEGNRGAMPGLVAKAKAGWEQSRPGLQKVLGEAEAVAIDRQIKAMPRMTPREQAVGALGVLTALSKAQGRGRKQEAAQAGRTAMLAWCLVDAGQLSPLPGVAEAFKPVIDGDKGQHTLVLVSVQDALKRLQDGQRKKQAAGVKKALRDLQKLAGVLEKA
ncbi:MAG: hypothetical protein U0P46_11590 [Holophagaceae bacterium]